MDFSTGSLSQVLQNEILNVAILIGGAWLGYKKLIKHGNKEDLDATKAKAEKNVIDLIYVRLTELEQTNKALTAELEANRKEIMVTRIQNEEMRKEVKQLKRFIELNFAPTHHKSN